MTRCRVIFNRRRKANGDMPEAFPPAGQIAWEECSEVLEMMDGAPLPALSREDCPQTHRESGNALAWRFGDLGYPSLVGYVAHPGTVFRVSLAGNTLTIAVDLPDEALCEGCGAPADHSGAPDCVAYWRRMVVAEYDDPEDDE